MTEVNVEVLKLRTKIREYYTQAKEDYEGGIQGLEKTAEQMQETLNSIYKFYTELDKILEQFQNKDAKN